MTYEGEMVGKYMRMGLERIFLIEQSAWTKSHGVGRRAYIAHVKSLFCWSISCLQERVFVDGVRS